MRPGELTQNHARPFGHFKCNRNLDEAAARRTLPRVCIRCGLFGGLGLRRLEIVVAGVKRHQESEPFVIFASVPVPGIHEMLPTIRGECRECCMGRAHTANLVEQLLRRASDKAVTSTAHNRRSGYSHGPRARSEDQHEQLEMDRYVALYRCSRSTPEKLMIYPVYGLAS
jgi:hypothetical protein